MAADTAPSVALSNGAPIPQLGMGVSGIPRPETAAAVKSALSIGYRHFDTATIYGNDAEVGEGVTASDIPRAEVFITNKLHLRSHTYDGARREFDSLLLRMGLDYLDLFLVHWPMSSSGSFTDPWRAFEKIYEEGAVRAIGVSNFQTHHLHELQATANIAPMVNQIECHPYLVQSELRVVNSQLGIWTEAWSPIAVGRVLSDPLISELAQDLGRTPAQVVLRWHIQIGNIVIPKSSNAARQAENLAVYDFSLDEDAIKAISGLDRAVRTGPDPDVFVWQPEDRTENGS